MTPHSDRISSSTPAITAHTDGMLQLDQILLLPWDWEAGAACECCRLKLPSSVGNLNRYRLLMPLGMMLPRLPGQVRIADLRAEVSSP